MDKKTSLIKFTLAAQKIIYDADRMKQFMKMLGSVEGAHMAVHSVMSAIEHAGAKIPLDIAPLLGVNIYMSMVDMARQATGLKPDPKILKGVILSLTKQIKSHHGMRDKQDAPPQESQQPAQPQGILQGAMA